MKYILNILIFGFFMLLCTNARGQNYYLIHDQVNIRSIDNNAGSVIYELANGNNSYFFHFGGDLTRNEEINFSTSQELSSLELRLGRSNSVPFCESNISEIVPIEGFCNPGAAYRYIESDGCTSWDVGIAFAKLGSFKTILTSPASSVNICERQNLDFFDETTYCSLGQIPYGVEYSLTANFANPQVLLAFGDHDTRFTFLPSDITNDPNNAIYIRVRRSTTQGDYMPGTAIYNLDGCSVALESTVAEDAVCYSENGEVTLTFEENVDQVGGYEMRYYIYEKPSNAPANATPTSVFGNGDLFTTDGEVNGVQAVDDVRFSPPDPVTNPKGQGYLTVDFEGAYSGLGAGTYYILYQEINFNVSPVSVKSGELIPDFFEIREPSEIIIREVTASQPPCTGDKGSIEIIAEGGGYNNTNAILEYRLSINGAAYINQDNNTFTDLDDGFYEIAVRNKANPTCELTYTSTITITSPSELLFTSTTPGIASSPIATDGQISAVYEGGTAGATGYTFELTKTTGTIPATASQDINAITQTVTYSGLDIGTYQIEITDANNCKASSGDIAITSAPLPTLGTPTYSAISCSGNSDGAFSIPVGYGAANNIATTISYRLIDSQDNLINSGTVIIDADPNTNHEINITGLASGTYTLAVIAATGDFDNTDTVVTSEIIIDPVDPIAIDFTASTITNASCNGLSDGNILLSVSGSTEYQYALSNFPAETDWVDLPLDNTIRDLAGITYSIILRNKNNTSCQSVVYSNAFEIIEPEALVITPTPVNVSTNGGSDGSISLEITGGTPGILPDPQYTFNWSGTLAVDGSTYSNNTQNINNLSAGMYQVIVTDANTCTETLPQAITVSEPGELSIQTPLIGADTCNGLDTGTISATVQGTGDILFEFLLNPGPTEIVTYSVTTADRTVTAPNLAAGTYGLRITEETSGNSMNLQANDYVTINELNPITAIATPTPIACTEFNTGVITITGVQGGNGNYEYQIDDGFPPQTNNIFSGLAPRTYAVTVRDALGCEFNTTVDIIQTGAPILDQVATVVTNASTDTSIDGSIVLEFETDATNYTYNWTGPGVTGITTKDLTGISAGSYQVTVSAPGNCTLIVPFTVAVAQAFAITSITPSPTCFNQTNGTLTATVEATGSVIHNWRNAVNDLLLASETTTVRTVTATGLDAGTYYLEIVDANDATITARSTNVEITTLADVNADIALTPTCSGASTGSITFSNPTGSLIDDYLFSIDGGANFVDSFVFNDLDAGTYQIVVRATDNTNCDQVVPGVVIQTSPPLLYDAANTMVTRASGPGATDGEIAVAFAQGTAPYQYSIDNGTTAQANPLFTGLAAGTYTIVATDAAGCSTTSENIVVTELGPLSITNIVASNALCRDEANGSIETTVTGEGTITYQWTLADGNDVPVSNGSDGEDITGILAGSYILTVIDANATVSSPAIQIGEPATALDITNITGTNSTCNGANDGTIQIVATGGTPPYQYSLNGTDFQNAATFNNLLAGQYPITVRDVNACLFTQPTPELLTEPLALDFIINEQRPLTAANAADGAIIITPEGGSGNYTYNWSGPNFTSTEKDIFGLTGGEYVLTLIDTDNPNCSIVSSPITIAEPGVLIATNAQTVLLECNGDDFAEIIATAQGGVAPFTYEWFQVINGNNNLLAEDTDIIANLSAGTYFVRITDANDVVADASPVVINEPTALQITVDATTNVQCSGQLTGAIAISVSGGTFPYQYVWSNGLTIEDVQGLDAGSYNIEVIDANGCIAEETITLTTPDDAVQIAGATLINVSAYNLADGSISLDVIGGSTPYTYAWTRQSDNSSIGTEATISNLATDSYTVSVTDVNGCTVTETYEITEPDIIEDTIVQPTCAGESNGGISVLVNQGNGTFTYNWSTGGTTNSITNLAAGSYSVTITGFGNGPLTRTYILEDPAPLEVNLGEDRVLCADQVLELDATVEDPSATYSWSSDTGFTSTIPNVILSQTGNYTVTVQTQTGCTVQGTISVAISTDEIDAEFAVSSQVFAGERSIAVDISYPLPETIAWNIPLGAEIITQNNDEVEFVFATPGEYEIGITTTRGGCIAQKTKKIIVVAKNGAIEDEDAKNGQKVVEDFIVYPNPTSGNFRADINLTERGTVSVKVFSFANNAMIASENDRGETAYSIPFDISGMPSGVYAVLLETSYGTSLRKVIVN